MDQCAIERPHRHKPKNRINIPWLAQIDDFSCGAIAGWTSIKALYPKRRNKKAFYRDCNPSKIYGTSTGKLARALRKHGVRVSIRSQKLTLKQIREAVDAGFPLIVCVRADEGEFHWTTVYGYSSKKRKVYLSNNGYLNFNGEMDFRRFKKIQEGEYLICSPRKTKT